MYYDLVNKKTMRFKMRKFTGFLTVLIAGAGLLISSSAIAAPKVGKVDEVQPTTRNDAVIFKIHNIIPVSKDGIVTGCDFDVTLYNRTAINFRNFTLNLNWNDTVEEQFQFNSYVKSILGEDTSLKEQELLGESDKAKPLATTFTVNAFGANKQISVKSHLDNEKCYLLLSKAQYSVTPCDIARSANTDAKVTGSDGKDCTALFQLVDTANPEYFGEFKDLSATEIASQNQMLHNQELSDIDAVIGKIIENLGVSDQTLTDIN